MNSPFANIYFSIMQRLLTITSGSPAAPTLRLIDMDYSQLETPERPSVAFPCTLIDFKDFVFTNLANLVQEGNGRVCLKIATDPYSSTSSITPDTYSKAALDILDLEYQVYRLLQGWSPAAVYDGSNAVLQTTRPLTRINLSSDNRRPGLKVREMHFACAYTDYSAKRGYTLTGATPVITGQIILPT